MHQSDTIDSKDKRREHTATKTLESITLCRELEDEPTNRFYIELVDNLTDIDAPFIVEMMDSYLKSDRQKAKDKRRHLNRKEGENDEERQMKSNNYGMQDANIEEFDCMMDDVYQPSMNSSN